MEPTPSDRPASERIVAVGLLTQRDVDALGLGFHRLFPLSEAPVFEELIRRLDGIAAIDRPD